MFSLHKQLQQVPIRGLKWLFILPPPQCLSPTYKLRDSTAMVLWVINTMLRKGTFVQKVATFTVTRMTLIGKDSRRVHPLTIIQIPFSSLQSQLWKFLSEMMPSPKHSHCSMLCFTKVWLHTVDILYMHELILVHYATLCIKAKIAYKPTWSYNSSPL